MADNVELAKQFLEQGHSEKEIEQAFRNAGYNDSEIKEIMTRAKMLGSSMVEPEDRKKDAPKNVFGAKVPKSAIIEEEPKKSHFDLLVIPGLYVNPKKYLKRVEETATWFEGLVLLLLTQIIVTLYAFFITNYFAPVSTAKPIFAGFQDPLTLSLLFGSLLLYTILVVHVANFLGGDGNTSRTLGAFGYIYAASFLWILFLGLVVFVPFGPQVVGLLAIIWGVYVVGNAIAVANRLPLFHALIDFFLVAIIYVAILAVFFHVSSIITLPI